MAKPKILIVDDEILIARELEARLSGLGYGMAGIACSGEEAIRSAYETQPDLVLMDIVLKGSVDGIAAADEIRKRLDIPTVFVTAYSDNSTLQRAKLTEPYGYVLKPFSEGEVHAAVELALHKHQMEMRAREAQEERSLLAAIVDSSGDAIISWTLAGTIFSWNAGAVRLYGYTAAEALGRTVSAFLVPLERRDEVSEILERIKVGEPTDRYETVRLRKDGTRVNISLTVSPIRAGDGEIIGASAIAHDITERKRVEKTFKLSDLRYRGLFETAGDGILLLDVETGEITDVNPCLAGMLGYSLEKVVSRKVAEDGPLKDLAAVCRLAGEVDLCSDHLPLKTRDGRHIDVELVSRVYLVNETKVLQCNVRDITRRKQVETAAWKLNKQLGALVSKRTLQLREKNDAMHEELQIAQELQRVMLRQQFPSVPRGTPPGESVLQFFSLYDPAGPVSGDFFDVIPLSDTTVGVFICDIVGHDVRAALVAAMMRTLVEEFGPQAWDPGRLLTETNRILTGIFRKGGSRVFATACYLVADVSRSQILYANAGHPSPLVVQRQQRRVTPLMAAGTQGPALGLFENATYESRESALTAGDLVMLLTDGIFEVEGPGEERYDQQRLIAAVRERVQMPAPALFRELLADAQQFAEGRKLEDDVCLLGMEVAPRA